MMYNPKKAALLKAPVWLIQKFLSIPLYSRIQRNRLYWCFPLLNLVSFVCPRRQNNRLYTNFDIKIDSAEQYYWLARCRYGMFPGIMPRGWKTVQRLDNGTMAIPNKTRRDATTRLPIAWVFTNQSISDQCVSKGPWRSISTICDKSLLWNMKN